MFWRMVLLSCARHNELAWHERKPNDCSAFARFRWSGSKSVHKAARKAARAAHVARQELIELTKKVDALKRQLVQSTKRLKTALK
jgi:hypothetical protein